MVVMVRHIYSIKVVGLGRNRLNLQRVIRLITTYLVTTSIFLGTTRLLRRDKTTIQVMRVLYTYLKEKAQRGHKRIDLDRIHLDKMIILVIVSLYLVITQRFVRRTTTMLIRTRVLFLCLKEILMKRGLDKLNLHQFLIHQPL